MRRFFRGMDDDESEAQFVEEYVGGLIVIDAFNELRMIRKALTKSK